MHYMLTHMHNVILNIDNQFRWLSTTIKQPNNKFKLNKELKVC